MELPYITNAPRELAIGGVIYRARALTLADLGEVLAWLEDRLPPDPERDGPILFGGDAARLALATTEGLAVVLHLCLASCQPGLTRNQARSMAMALSPEETARLHAIAFRRRPSYGTEGDGPPPKDLAELRWGEVIEALAQHRAWVYPEVARLTLDQYDCVAARGEVAMPGDLKSEEVQAMWERAMTKDEANGEQTT